VLDRIFSGDVGEDETCEYATSFSTTLRTHSVPIKRLLEISCLVVRFGSELPMACQLKASANSSRAHIRCRYHATSFALWFLPLSASVGFETGWIDLQAGGPLWSAPSFTHSRVEALCVGLNPCSLYTHIHRNNYELQSSCTRTVVFSKTLSYLASTCPCVLHHLLSSRISRSFAYTPHLSYLSNFLTLLFRFPSIYFHFVFAC